ncbi:hypothetical protein J5J86_02840 [Aquabacter sp. L1I39]|uniref:hypothetical protein n=1 Tax=Aquabacter sp. L1I39 TaxID=2820278 RepID=UPI001ADD23F1|nr:hypothetical protein [Aquabacter sp. L1I39]QTL04301.1 hypothetical protein J5J86_02840 [Aquabacter sp. L1I39]
MDLFEALPSVPGKDPALATLVSALERLEELVDQETEALRLRAPLDLADINRRKSRSLLELSRAARGVDVRQGDLLQERLDRLRGKLVDNQGVLSLHLAAAQEVGAILDQALRDAESDGTYSTYHAAEGRGGW